MISNRELSLEKKFYEELRNKYKKRISYYPKGEVYFKYEHGKHRAYQKNGNERAYLNSTNRQLIEKLLKKKLDVITLGHIETNIAFIEKMQNTYKGVEWIFGDATIMELENNIGKGFKVADFLTSVNNSKQTKPYLNEFRIDEKIHTTPAGVAVRSRAELVIASFLEAKGIEYTYEKPLKLFLNTVAPDFTIKRKSDGKTIIWEHFGMMDDPGYYESRMELISDYHHGGWLPYDNFIATFGEKNSPIDMTTIETIYETMLK